MIYYIVPPIIIVAILGVLIFFISRKSDAIRKEIQKEKELELEGSGRVIISKLHVFSLAFLEKMMLRVKLFFLKSYNQFDHWVHSVRSRKEAGRERIENIEEARAEAEARESRKEEGRKILEIAAKTEKTEEQENFQANPDPKTIRAEEIKIPEKLSRMALGKNGEAKSPMVSKRAVQPEISRKKKSHLEEALIERIALSPRDIEAYERLGDYYLEQNNDEDALECFRQVLKLSPGNHKAKMRLKKLEKNILGW